MKYFVYRIISPFIDIGSAIQSFKNIFRYPGFFMDYISYKNKSKNEIVDFIDLYPCVADKTSVSQSGKGHYFYQDVWALGKLFKNLPKNHIDVGSRIDGFAGQCSAFCNVEFVDLRPVDLGINNFQMKKGDILNLPYDNQTIDSLSCLHVVEHIGLGRYGDDVDSEGSRKAMKELQRILRKDGYLYFGIPVGRERVMFNAHRVHYPSSIIKAFDQCELLEFSIVDDSGKFISNADSSKYDHSNYACGLFYFKKK